MGLKMISEADRIRQCAVDYYFEPARKRREIEVSIRAGDLEKRMGLINRTPNVCSVLGGKKLLDHADVRKFDYKGPPSGQGPNATFTYKLVKDTAGTPSGNKAIVNPRRIRRDAEAEAKIREMSEELEELKKRADDALASLWWHPYFVGVGFAFAFVAALSAILS